MQGDAQQNVPMDAASFALILGQVQGQLREIIHGMNNEQHKSAALAAVLAKLDGVPDRLEKIEKRLGELEVLRHRRDGASGLGVTLLRSPALGWLIGAFAAVWVYLHDGVKP